MYSCARNSPQSAKECIESMAPDILLLIPAPCTNLLSLSYSPSPRYVPRTHYRRLTRCARFSGTSSLLLLALCLQQRLVHPRNLPSEPSRTQRPRAKSPRSNFSSPRTTTPRTFSSQSPFSQKHTPSSQANHLVRTFLVHAPRRREISLPRVLSPRNAHLLCRREDERDRETLRQKG